MIYAKTVVGGFVCVLVTNISLIVHLYDFTLFHEAAVECLIA